MLIKTDFIENNNIKEHNLGVKKLHLNKRGNNEFDNDNSKYLNLPF